VDRLRRASVDAIHAALAEARRHDENVAVGAPGRRGRSPEDDGENGDGCAHHSAGGSVSRIEAAIAGLRRSKRLGGARTVASVLVLAELPLADDALDRDLDADDARQHVVDVRRVGVRHLPRLRVAGRGLVPAREPRDDAAHEALVVADRHLAVHVHDAVVPGRDLAMRFVLARVPVRRDVRVLGAEDHQRLVAVAHLAPHRIRARDVRDQRAARTLVGHQLERDVVRVEAVGPRTTSAPSGWSAISAAMVVGTDSAKCSGTYIARL
jgi:hypothetical protein